MTLLAVVGVSATSDASPDATCPKVCRRFSSCRLLAYDRCMDMCRNQRADATPEGRAENLAQASMSCKALAEQMASSDWLCAAEGACEYGYSYGVKTTWDIYQLGTGKTRSAAMSDAIRNCNSIMRAQLLIQGTPSDSSTLWEAEITSKCHITKCAPPASARKTRQP